MPLDNGDARIGPEPIEVRTAIRARIRDIRQVGIGDVAVARRRVAMIRAVLRSEAAGVVAVSGGNHILRGIVAAGTRVAEVRRRAHRLGSNLRLFWLVRCGRTIVVPVAGIHVRLVADRRAGAVAEDGAARHTLAVLGHGVQPGAAADRIQERFQNARLAARVVVRPLRAPEDQIDLRRGLNPDATGAAVVDEVFRGAAAARLAVGPVRFTHALRLRDGQMNDDRRLALLDVSDDPGRTYSHRARLRANGQARQCR